MPGLYFGVGVPGFEIDWLRQPPLLIWNCCGSHLPKHTMAFFHICWGCCLITFLNVRRKGCWISPVQRFQKISSFYCRCRCLQTEPQGCRQIFIVFLLILLVIWLRWRCSFRACGIVVCGSRRRRGVGSLQTHCQGPLQICILIITKIHRFTCGRKNGIIFELNGSTKRNVFFRRPESEHKKFALWWYSDDGCANTFNLPNERATISWLSFS
mmetsp:Transcript_97026/g.280013  ORF Transcript_97026/g.280013 Transcript_97026/m.280013 type:complete len:212 (+) Transcript_97026:1497-2132(+)